MRFSLKDTPIRRKLMVIILLTSVVVLLLMQGAFFTYEYLTFRRATVHQLATLAEILAANSTAALAFENQDDAAEILAALKAQRHVATAALYRADGRLFSGYPQTTPATALPRSPGADGYRFTESHLAIFQPVLQSTRRLGTLYIDLDIAPLVADWLWASALLGGTMMTLVLLIAYALSRALQKQISEPILALARTATAVSENRDYAVRATRMGGDEIGRLTDAFNQMLAQIQQREQALHERERRFRALIEHSTDSIVVIDADNTITYASPAVAAIEGYSPEELQRRNGLDDTHPDDLPLIHATLARLLAHPGTPVPVLWRRRHKLGHWLWLEGVSTNLLHDPAIRGIVTNYRDVTQRQEAGAEIRRLNATLEARVAERTVQLESANRELEAFSYSVSHDLRAPLRHIDGFASLLANHAATTLDEKGRRYVAVISDAARKMGRLIDDLLTFSRMGRVQLAPGEIDQDVFVAGIIREGAFDKDRPVTWQISPLPRVRADAALLRQVWFNLIDNAVKYSSRSPAPRIEIGGGPDAATGEQIFYVRDNGVGFDMKYADKLFGVFQRLHSESEFHGIGIGLANVRRIIARHGGRTWAESTPGAGATFYFSLPARPPPTNTARPFA